VLSSSFTCTSAFTPNVMPASLAKPPAFVRSNSDMRITSTNLRMANVSKLSDPINNLLYGVDVFIFDCDGVIWRVRAFVDFHTLIKQRM